MSTRAILVLIGGLTVVAACDEGSAVKESGTSGSSSSSSSGGSSGSVTDAGDDGGDCVMNPKTHLEIINACTNATKITKNPALPKLLADGGLPPLN